MRFLLAAFILLSAGLCPAQDAKKRLTTLEKRVTKVEKRVTRLEGGAQPAAAAAKPMPLEPVAVYLIRKQQLIGQKKVGLRLYLEFENVSNRRLYAFNGTLVFRNEKGAVIWSKPYGHSEPLGPAEKVGVSLGLLTDQAKAYLAFVRALKITVELKKQEAYGAE
ncbi:MAG: hypothetical protein A2X31_08970 [Elusimicrobia bacterium GWB2_63_22]|nr:MAG: hypothetical protein A2X31_08970 [Elusimicrobia bacterium GWB2_63_22]